MTQKRFLIFDAYYGTAGGNQRYIRMLFEHAGRDGWWPTLLCPGEGRLPETVREAGGDVAIVPQSERLNRYGGSVLKSGLFSRVAALMSLLVYNFRVLPTLRAIRPQVVQCHNTRSLLMVVLAAKIARIPTVLFIKSEISNPFLDRIGMKLATRVLFIADVLMPKKQKSKYRKMPIGIDFSDVDATVARRQIDSDPEDHKEHLTFAFAGWLVPAKGVHILLDAFERTTHQVSDIRLDVIGESDDAEYKAELNNVVAWQKLQKRVTFHGWREDVLDALDTADIYVLPSFTEGIPRSIVEAMALGKPVIATSVGGIPELLENGELGMIVPPDDSMALANAMYEMAADKVLRAEFSKRGIVRVREKYSFENHHARLESLLDEVSGRTAPVRQPAGQEVSV
jgi:L-malate glycosyltransferase